MYKVADGHDVAEVSLNTITPQPHSKGIQYTRVTVAADRSRILEGPYVELIWSVVGSKTLYQSILAAFGLLNADSNDVTVMVRNENFDFVRQNGTAFKPLPEDGVTWSKYFPRQLVILISDLEDPS